MWAILAASINFVLQSSLPKNVNYFTQENARGGRDYCPRPMFCLMGGGIRGGQVVVGSGGRGEAPTQDPFTRGDAAATVYKTRGIKRTKMCYLPSMSRSAPPSAAPEACCWPSSQSDVFSCRMASTETIHDCVQPASIDQAPQPASALLAQ